MIELLAPLIGYEWYGNTILDYLLAIVAFVVLVVVLRIAKAFLMRWLDRIARRTDNDVDNAIYRVFLTIKPQFYWFLSFYFALQLLEFADRPTQFIKVILIIWVAYQVIVALQIFVDYFIERKVRSADDHGTEVVAGIAGGVSRIVLWSVGIMFVLSNLGVNITSLVAGLGIGGIAVALAAQSILADLFSSLAIYFDRPFEVGDYIVSGEISGTVTKVGIKTTRIKALSGEEVVVPNKNITDSRVKNYKRMTERRVAFELGVEPSTSQEKLKRIPQLLQTIIEQVADLRFSRAHFKAFNEGALLFEIVYHVESREYDVYMDRQQEVLLAIKAAFEQEHIALAFPTPAVRIVKE